MDWFSWLSNSNLDPSLVYEYGLAFTRNELQTEDLTHFSHEFLQSMGISVAKHRLEILKLARKEVGEGPKSLSRIVLAMNRATGSLRNSFGKWVLRQDSMVKAIPEADAQSHRGKWRRGLSRKWKSEKKPKVEPPPAVITNRLARSGPLDRRVQENLMITNRKLKLSGPLDGRIQERFVFADKSPTTVSGIPDGRGKERYVVSSKSRSPQLPISLKITPPIIKDYTKAKAGDVSKANGDSDDSLLWAKLFQDMKPT